MGRIALIDGDILLYSVGFSVDHNKYDVSLDGEFLHSFPSSKRLWDWIPYCSEEVLGGLTIEKRVESDPLPFAYHNLKQTIEGICRAVDAAEYEIYLTGKGNFRESIAVTKPYKGNRDPEAKPVYYQNIKDKLRSDYGAVIVDGQEADDMLGIRYGELSGRGLDPIICTKDKDLNMIPGWHYNMNNGEIFNVTEEEGIKWFYKQLLTGDPVDNIQGIPKVGEKKASKILEGICDGTAAYLSVQKEYIKAFGETAEERLLENGRLLWIRRKEGEEWQPPES